MKMSKLIMIIATVAISMTVLIASANIQEEKATAADNILVGSVVDASDYEGIAGAEVIIYDTEHTATTDEYGSFTIEGLEEGTYTITVNAEGYYSAEEEVEITEEGASVEFVLEAEVN